jgi:hypothetical protein
MHKRKNIKRKKSPMISDELDADMDVVKTRKKSGVREDREEEE